MDYKEPNFITFCREVVTAGTAREYVWNTVAGLEHFERRQHMKVTPEEAQAALDHWEASTDGARQLLSGLLTERPRGALATIRRFLPWDAKLRLDMKNQT